MGKLIVRFGHKIEFATGIFDLTWISATKLAACPSVCIVGEKAEIHDNV